MPEKKSKAMSDKVFVRAPDGALYILSKNKPPYRLKANEEKTVERIVSDAHKQVEEQLKNQLPGFGSMVNLWIGPSPFR